MGERNTGMPADLAAQANAEGVVSGEFEARPAEEAIALWDEPTQPGIPAAEGSEG